MTNAEMVKAFSEAGLKAADLKKIEKKVDAEKITKAVESAATLEDGIKAVCKLHPELNAKELKKQMDFYADQLSSSNSAKTRKLDEAMELTEDELEHVAGGTGSSSINWKAILIGVACALVCAGVAAGFSAAFAPVGAKIANAVVWGAVAGTVGGFFGGITASSFMDDESRRKASQNS
jgi:hypothetical protein